MGSKDNFSDAGTWSVSSLEASKRASNSQMLLQETCVDAMYTKREIPSKKPKTNKNSRKPRKYMNYKTLKNKALIRQTELAEKRLKCKKKLTSKKMTSKKTLASKPKPQESSDESASDEQQVNEPQTNLARNTLPENSQVNWLEWLTMKEVCKPPKPLHDFKTKLSSYPYPALDEGAEVQSDDKQATLRTGLTVKRFPHKINVIYNPELVVQENPMPQEVLRNPFLPFEDDYLRPESFQKEVKIDFSPESNQNDTDTNCQRDLVSQRINKIDGMSNYLSVYMPQKEMPPASLDMEPNPSMMHHKPKSYINNYGNTEQQTRHSEPQRMTLDIDSDISIGNHKDRTPLKVKLNPKYKTKAVRGPKKCKKSLKKKPKAVLKQKPGLKLKKMELIGKVKGKKRIGKRSMEAKHKPPGRWWLSRWIWASASDLDK